MPLVGRRVLVKGVRARAEYNGQFGVASAFSYTKGRYRVVLDSDPHKPIMLRPRNVFLIEEEGDASSAMS